MDPYNPQKLPLDQLRWDRLAPWIGQANRQLGLYDGLLRSIVNPAIFLSPLTMQEAVLSSRIEGTQASLEEVLLYEAAGEPPENRLADIQEVINYRQALDYAVKRMETYPLSLNLVKEIHSILLDGVRGKFRGRGEFRRVQNWIGGMSTNQDQARYVPPPPEQIMLLLDNWEKYIHSDEKDSLVQLAIVHAQFEVIHPFVDGNGRVGRILVPLFLYQKKCLSQPVFYASAYLEAHRSEYIDRLYQISETQAWDDWIIFFLKAITEQAKSDIVKAQAIMNLYEEMKRRIPDLTGSRYAIQTIDALFRHPIFNVTDFMKTINAPRPSAVTMLNKLREGKIIMVLQEGSGRKPHIYGFRDLLSIILVSRNNP